jgi:hypothetical protein
MKKFIATGSVLFFSLLLFSQNSFQTALQTGFAFPLASGDLMSAHNAKGMHFGNHFDYIAGGEKFRFGFGAYAGQILSFSVGDYKQKAQEIAGRYRFATDKINYKESAFRSTSFLLGPVADIKTKRITSIIWAKGGYSFNEPGNFSAVHRENGLVNTLYKNESGESENSFAYSLGAGIRYDLSQTMGLQLSAGYYDTKTELVNYHYDREKGLSPFVFSASNKFIQAALGLQINIGSERKEPLRSVDMASIKRDNFFNNERDNDTIYFLPVKIELRTTQNTSFGERLNSVNNFLTAFAYRTESGNMISQCSGMKRPGEPIPGIDVRLLNSTSGKTYSVRTNEDGSFTVRDIEPGTYQAVVNEEKIIMEVDNTSENAVYKLAESENDNCGRSTNTVVYIDEVMYAEVIALRDAASGPQSGQTSGKRINGPRDVASGQSSGKRIHHPLQVVNTLFDLNYNNIIRMGDRLYAEVKTARDAGSGMASGKRTLIHGDLDGDGLSDKIVEKKTEGLKQTMQTQVLMINNEEDDDDDMIIVHDADGDGLLDVYVKAPRDAASGQASGKISYQTLNNMIASGRNVYIIAPRDAASGMASGKRMHKPYLKLVDEDEANRLYGPRDVATGQSSGKRTHTPGTDSENGYNVNSPRDAASGMASGKRMHKPYLKLVDEDEANRLYGPRDIATGQSSGKRTHKTDASKKRFSAELYTEDMRRMIFDIDGSKGSPVRLAIPLSIEGENVSTWKSGGQYAVSAKGANGPAYTVNTSRSNIKSGRQYQNMEITDIKSIRCSDGSCFVEVLVTVGGISYEAIITGQLRKGHDTVKNSVGNIR